MSTIKQVSGVARLHPDVRRQLGPGLRRDTSVKAVIARVDAIDTLAVLLKRTVDEEMKSDGRIDWRDVAAKLISTLSPHAL